MDVPNLKIPVAGVRIFKKNEEVPKEVKKASEVLDRFITRRGK